MSQDQRIEALGDSPQSWVAVHRHEEAANANEENLFRLHSRFGERLSAHQVYCYSMTETKDSSASRLATMYLAAAGCRNPDNGRENLVGVHSVESPVRPI